MRGGNGLSWKQERRCGRDYEVMHTMSTEEQCQMVSCERLKKVRGPALCSLTITTHKGRVGRQGYPFWQVACRKVVIWRMTVVSLSRCPLGASKGEM